MHSLPKQSLHELTQADTKPMLQELVQSKVEAMLAKLWHDSQHGSSPLQRSIATRDGFAFSLLWSTGLRGINAREVCSSDFWLPSTSAQPCQPALPSIFPFFRLEIGSIVELVPQRLKTSISANSASIQLIVQADQLLDPLFWLHWHIQSSYAAGSPISNLLVRPLNRQGTAYLEKPLQNASLLSRLTSLLQQLQLYEGESLHSFRRGMAQQLKAHGKSEAEILQQLLIKTPAVLQSRYLASGRYHSGVKRLHSSSSRGPDSVGMQTVLGHAARSLPTAGGSGAHPVEAWVPADGPVSHYGQAAEQGGPGMHPCWQQQNSMAGGCLQMPEGAGHQGAWGVHPC